MSVSQIIYIGSYLKIPNVILSLINIDDYDHGYELQGIEIGDHLHTYFIDTEDHGIEIEISDIKYVYQELTSEMIQLSLQSFNTRFYKLIEKLKELSVNDYLKFGCLYYTL